MSAEELALLRAAVEKLTLGQPASLAPRSAHAEGIPFEEFCRSRDLEDDWKAERSFRPLREGTWLHEQRILRGLVREGVRTDPPDLEGFLGYVRSHPKGEAGLDNQRRAFARIMEFHGQTIPKKLKRRWDTKDAVADAKRSGAPIRVRERFFRDPIRDPAKLIAATPWKRAELNRTFQHAVALSCVTGPRGGEARELRVANVNADARVINDWYQQKKAYGRRVLVPEAWLYSNPAGPTVRNYLGYVRPVLDSKLAQSHYFLNGWGVPFASDAAWRGFLGEGIRKTLGYSIGPHAFRRWCATMRRVFGWQVPEIAALLDDTDEVVLNSYIDARFVNSVGIRPRKGDDKPALPPLWKLEESF